MKKNDLTDFEHEQVPEWLANYKRGRKLSINKILQSKLVYYPGSFVDLQPVKVFNLLYGLHTYLYVDYGHSKDAIIQAMSEQNYDEYDLYDIREFNLSDIKLKTNEAHYQHSIREQNDIRDFSVTYEYGLVFIFQRKKELEHDILCSRFAIIYMCCDGITTYDKLFQNYKSLHALVIQDHGFGGNYSSFGADGAMYKIAKTIDVFPKYILCARSSKMWEGYMKIKYSEDLPTCWHERDIYESSKLD